MSHNFFYIFIIVKSNLNSPLFLFNNFITYNPCISNGFVIYIVYDIICYCGYSVYGYNDTQRQKRLF